MNQNSPKTFEEIKPLIIHHGNRILQFAGGEFTLDKGREKIYRDVYECMVQISSTMNNKKGIIVVGGVGTGKTIMMKIYSHILRDAEGLPVVSNMVDSNSIIRDFLINGFEVIDRYSRMHKFPNKYSNKPKGLCIDDLGMEDQKVKSYGNEANVIADILFSRYNEMIDAGMRTFATSNVAPAKLGALYGERIADRMIEMFNTITLTGDSLRK